MGGESLKGEEGLGETLAGDPAMCSEKALCAHLKCDPSGLFLPSPALWNGDAAPNLMAGERHNQLPIRPRPATSWDRTPARVINQSQRFSTCFSSYTPQG